MTTLVKMAQYGTEFGLDLIPVNTGIEGNAQQFALTGLRTLW
jgi:hypothetical protein